MLVAVSSGFDDRAQTERKRKSTQTFSDLSALRCARGYVPSNEDANPFELWTEGHACNTFVSPVGVNIIPQRAAFVKGNVEQKPKAEMLSGWSFWEF